jgi:sulfite exporter TauE/SafE
METVWLAFITGLTSGGISCVAVQGGLLTSAISGNSNQKSNKLLVGAFLAAKIFAYTILGFLLGFLGSYITISPKISAIIQIMIGVFLIATAGRILNLHPIFRYFVIQPPKFVYRYAKNQSEKRNLFAPIILGFLTILMPCGVTQAMMIVALGSANPVQSALIMLAFTLGTSPVFFVLGISLSKLIKYKVFNYVSAAIILIFAVVSLNSAMGLFGSVHTLQNYWAVATGKSKNQEIRVSKTEKGYQEVTITVLNNGYKSDINTLKLGITVRLKIITDNIYSCSRAFTIPSLNISKVLPATGEEVIEFTPNKLGRLAYSCSMGMYTGAFNVVE